MHAALVDRGARLARSLALSLTRCPGCSSRPPAPRGCCDDCWSRVVEPLVLPDVVAVGRYGGPLGAVLRAAKFGAAALVLDALGERLGELLVDAGLGGRPLVPVPSHPRRRRRRGPDPSWLLATRAGTGAVVAALARGRDGPPQSRTRPEAREENVASAFVPTAEARGLPRGAEVVLVDDVLTTGATARACRRALDGVGAPVRVVAVAALA